MHWLSVWLKSIIVVILFAAFVDLLLPSNKMQRYVKTVISLFILLTLLSPILNLLRGDWNINKLLAQAEREQAASSPVFAKSSAKLDVQAIAREGERLKQSADRQALQLAEEQIAKGIKEQIGLETAFEAVQVWVKTAQDGEGKPFITSVETTLQERKAAQKSGQLSAGTDAATADPNAMKPVEPVKPVEIDVRVGNDRTVTGETAKSADSEAEHKAKDDVTRLLERNWGVSQEKVVIRFQAGLRQKS